MDLSRKSAWGEKAKEKKKKHKNKKDIDMKHL